MSYAVNLERDNQETHAFVRMAPRMRVETWTLASGSVYWAAFKHGPVVRVEVDGVALNEGSSPSLSAGQYWYDWDAGRVYVRLTSGTPTASKWIVATFELYLSTKETIWFRDPTDTGSREVVWRGLIKQAPEAVQSTALIVFGFMPTNSSDIELAYDRDYLQELLFGASFHRADVKVWHLVGDLDTDNIKAIFTGVAGNYAASSDAVRIALLDKVDVLDAPVDVKKWTSGSYPNMDPSFDGKAMQTIYGMVEGIRGVNVTFRETSPAVSDNRDWGFCERTYGNGQINAAITGLLGSFFVNVSIPQAKQIAQRLNALSDSDWPGERRLYCWLHNGSYSGGYYTYILSVNQTTGLIELNDSVNVFTTWTLSIPQFNQVQLVRGGSVKYQLKYGRDYTEIDIGSNARGIRLSTSLESTLSISVLTPSQDTIMACYAWGYSVLPTLGGASFGSLRAGVCDEGVTILYHFLKDRLGFTEAEIDTAQFVSMLAKNSQSVGFAVPQSKDDSEPTYKDVVTALLTTLLLKCYFDPEGRLVIDEIAPLTAADFEASEDDIQAGSLSFEYSYDDLAAVKVTYGVREVFTDSPKNAILFGTSNSNFKVIEGFQRVVGPVGSQAYSYLHKGTRSVEISSYSSKDPFMRRILALAGDRVGRIALTTTLRFAQAQMNDAIDLTSARLPGYAAGVEGTRRASVIEVRKQKSKVTLVLDDQKAIADSGGTW